MPTFAALIQTDMVAPNGTNAVFNIFFGLVDSTTPKATPAEVQLEVPMDSPGTWKDSFVAAVIAHAATLGYTVPISNVRWYPYEPGDYKYTEMVAAWTKDVTKTNLGTSYVNAYAGNAGEAQLVDFSSFKQYRFVVAVNKIGTGTQSAALVDTANVANLVELVDAAAAGEHTLDSGWTNLPAWATGEKIIKPMVKTSLAGDDPVYRSFALYLR